MDAVFLSERFFNGFVKMLIPTKLVPLAPTKLVPLSEKTLFGIPLRPTKRLKVAKNASVVSSEQDSKCTALVVNGKENVHLSVGRQFRHKR